MLCFSHKEKGLGKCFLNNMHNMVGKTIFLTNNFNKEDYYEEKIECIARSRPLPGSDCLRRRRRRDNGGCGDHSGGCGRDDGSG